MAVCQGVCGNVNRPFDTIYKKVTLKKRLKMRLVQGPCFLSFSLFGNQHSFNDFLKIISAPGM